MIVSPGKILMVHADKTERGKPAITLARFGHCVFRLRMEVKEWN